MYDYNFSTPEPIELHVEIDRGSVDIETTDSPETTVEVDGRDPDRVTVEHTGRKVSIITDRRIRLFRDDSVRVRVSTPAGGELVAKVGSADLTTRGEIADTRIKSGSGQVRLDEQSSTTTVVAGSGHVHINLAWGDLRIKNGSGGVTLGHTSARVSVVTGSGDVEIDRTEDRVEVKAGSGGVRLIDAIGDVKVVTGSGSLVIEAAHGGRITTKSGSGNVTIGIPPAVPVWADVRTGSGRFRSDIDSPGEPGEGEAYVEVRGSTGSGDISIVPATVSTR